MTKIWKQHNRSTGDDCLSGTLRVKQVGFFGLKWQAIQDRKQDPLLYAAFGFRCKTIISSNGEGWDYYLIEGGTRIVPQ